MSWRTYFLGGGEAGAGWGGVGWGGAGNDVTLTNVFLYSRLLDATELKALVEEKLAPPVTTEAPSTTAPPQVTRGSSVHGCVAACFSSERKGTTGKEVDPRWKPRQLLFARDFLCFGSPVFLLFFLLFCCAHTLPLGGGLLLHTRRRGPPRCSDEASTRRGSTAAQKAPIKCN
ncbi:hypothetical protein TraAM80_09854 [Trypanosoma rangeli]|uniref:Uncharacterized protein n=1 Tax=Trypanosoma rangeli TaxID=5698 RepID=A0A3R7R5M9_TRYRA|nr:uncharacterized protein TraAM80_09854 [Trypanosoma rangeli]RNE96419.1 hypothetical protein TraAM80_09854 [Trypanosoma rangeli]|eukprot:RNE96419.1 hypothetical protein TraAM80_09854 [Trypanosoma rangeli]